MKRKKREGEETGRQTEQREGRPPLGRKHRALRTGPGWGRQEGQLVGVGSPMKLQDQILMFPSLMSGLTEIFTLLGCGGKLICSKKMECATVLPSVSWYKSEWWGGRSPGCRHAQGSPASARAGHVRVDTGWRHWAFQPTWPLEALTVS